MLADMKFKIGVMGSASEESNAMMKPGRTLTSAALSIGVFVGTLFCPLPVFGQQQVLSDKLRNERPPSSTEVKTILPSSLEVRQDDDNFGQRISLAALASHALANNPEIQAAQQRYRAALARPSQAGSLPDPMIEGSYHNEKFDSLTLGRSDFSFLGFGASQELPFPGKLSLREQISTKQAEQEAQAVRATILSVTSRLTVAYADLAFTYQGLSILQRNKGFLLDLQKSAEARYQVGQGIQQDVVKAQVEVSLLTSRVIQFERKKQGFQAIINGLLNRPPLEPLGTPEPLKKARFTRSIEEIRDLALENSPELNAAQIGIARSELGLSLAEREYYPDFVAKADYFNKSGLTPEWEIGLGVKVPLYFWRKQRYGVQEASASVGEARGTRQNVVQTLLAQVKDLYVQARAAEQLLTLYQTTVIPQSRLSLDSATAAYAVGTVDFLTLLNNVLVLREAELSYQEQLAEYEKSLAQLEAIVGTQLAGK